MKNEELVYLSLPELKELQERIARTIDTKALQLRKEALAAARKSAEDLGFDLDDLLANRPKRKVPAKYRDPNNYARTWSGRGRKPAWFVAALEKGTTPDDMEI